MSTEPQLFRVNPENQATETIEEVDFSHLGIRERRDIQEWVAANPGILGENLLVIAKEFSGFDRTNERLDLLAVDEDGKLVVIELKRDDSGTDVHWQAIKYASYLHRASSDDIIRMLASKETISQEQAADRLIQHIGADDLNALNNDQRIIMASHRFAPEVTSAVLWLNDKAPGENLITCVKLTPHRDANTNSLYVQASTIIPMSGIDELVINVGEDSTESGGTSSNNFASNLRKAYARNKNDVVTGFLRSIRDAAVDNLQANMRPDRRSKWAGGWLHHRYYHLWYKRKPWSNWGLSYRVNLYPKGDEGKFSAEVEFAHYKPDMESRFAALKLHEDQQIDAGTVKVPLGTNTLNRDFATLIGQTTRRFIEQITPLVDTFVDEANQEDN